MSYRFTVFSLLSLCLLVAAWHVTPSMAAATEESELECQPREVEPNQPFRCYIYVRDALQEPTTRFNLSDFTIRVLPEVQSAVVTVTDPVVSDDPTIIEFTVASSEGTNLRIAVVSTDTGRFIRSSELIVAVLTWPASKLGAITCDTSVLTLRSSTICTADVTSETGLPAVVHSNDVYFSEDHSAGSFVFLRGVRQLRFNFTAPASLHSPLKVFVLRITLAGVTTVYTIRIPMAYPALPATERSVLRCTSTADQIQPCFVNAADAVGPVLFNPSQFRVFFERIRDNAWVDNTANVVYSWKTGSAGDASMLLQFAPVVDNEVYTSRLRVLTNTSEQREILNSPIQFMMGTPPTWQQLSFRGCNSSFLTVGNVTMCTIDVSTGVSADPAYVKIRGDLRGSTITGPVFKYIKKTDSSVLTFTYSPPTTSTRQDEFLTVTVGGMNIVRSPWRLVVYPAAIDVVVTDTSSNRNAIIAVGLVYFGIILATGGTILLLLERQKGRVKKLRSEQAHKQLMSRMSDRIRESGGGSSVDAAHTLSPIEGDKPLTEGMSQVALTAHQLAEGSAAPLAPRSALPTDGTTIRDHRPKTPEMVM